MQFADREAHRLRSKSIGTEHILLGLVQDGKGVAVYILKSLHVELDDIRLEVEKRVSVGPEVEMPIKREASLGAKQVVENAMATAREMSHNYIGSEHILIGLLREQEGVAAQVLMQLGVTSQKILPWLSS